MNDVARSAWTCSTVRNVLYITSATSGLDGVARAVQPQAGSVFALGIGVAGVPVSAFKG